MLLAILLTDRTVQILKERSNIVRMPRDGSLGELAQLVDVEDEEPRQDLVDLVDHQCECDEEADEFHSPFLLSAEYFRLALLVEVAVLRDFIRCDRIGAALGVPGLRLDCRTRSRDASVGPEAIFMAPSMIQLQPAPRPGTSIIFGA